MSELQARRLKPGQEVQRDDDPHSYGVVLGVLRSGVSVSWKTDYPMIEVVTWPNVKHLQLWQPS
jgi:hypothetical protein